MGLILFLASVTLVATFFTFLCVFVYASGNNSLKYFLMKRKRHVVATWRDAIDIAIEIL